MNRSTKLIMPHNLCFRILMFENCQQVKQRKTLRLCSRIRRTAFFIQSTFIADSNTVPVESSHMRPWFRYRPAMVKFPIAGDVKMITYILETSLQMTLAKLLYGEGNRGCVKTLTQPFFYAQSPDFLKPGLCYYPKFSYL